MTEEGWYSSEERRVLWSSMNTWFIVGLILSGFYRLPSMDHDDLWCKSLLSHQLLGFPSLRFTSRFDTSQVLASRFLHAQVILHFRQVVALHMIEHPQNLPRTMASWLYVATYFLCVKLVCNEQERSRGMLGMEWFVVYSGVRNSRAGILWKINGFKFVSTDDTCESCERCCFSHVAVYFYDLLQTRAVFIQCSYHSVGRLA